MDVLYNFEVYCKTTMTWRPCHQTSFLKLANSPMNAIPYSSTRSSVPLVLQSHYSGTHASPDKVSTKHTTLLVESFHETHRLKVLLQRINTDSNPLQILCDDGDWNKEQFWAVVRFLMQAGRTKEIFQVFKKWKNIEKSRINELNYNKIIALLSEVGLVEEAVSALQEKKSYNLSLSLENYNCIVHGFAKKGSFEDALLFLNEMEEINLRPDTETYDGLIQAYGNFRMYDEMVKCVKKMESNGGVVDHVTYNLLIREFSRGGLLTRMESMYQRVLSKRMALQSSTLVAMLEVYAKFRMMEKMEKVYRRIWISKTTLNEDLIRKVARVYIENYMFSRLDDLGNDLASRNDKTGLVWCLRLLSHACALSRTGMDSIVREMEDRNVSWNVTDANIILLACLKMKDFKRLKTLILELPIRNVKPDIVTVGVVYDAMKIGLDGTQVVSMWRRRGFFDEDVDMNTDPLVLAAFGKGWFLGCCEDMFSNRDFRVQENEVWTYRNLIDLVLKHGECLLVNGT